MKRIVRQESGFTLVELVVAMTFGLLFAALVLGFMISFWSATATLQNNSETFIERQNAGDRLREALNPASHLITQNSINDSNAEVQADATHWTLIHAIPTTINLPASGSYASVFYFEAPSTNTSKAFIMNGAQPFYDEFILYLNGTTKQLLMRTLVNPGATGDRLKTSCPASSATVICPADTVIASDITKVDTRYFSRSGNTIDYTSVIDPNTGNYIGPDFPAVDVVEVTMHLGRASKLGGGETTLDQQIVRVALRNQ